MTALSRYVPDTGSLGRGRYQGIVYDRQGGAIVWMCEHQHPSDDAALRCARQRGQAKATREAGNDER